MAKCYRCGAETQLYDGGTPICLECASIQKKPIEKSPSTKNKPDEGAAESSGSKTA